MKKQNGFTLIELLIVIAIIGVLATLIVPAVTNALKNSRRITAMNNMKQFAAWMVQYTNENKERMAEDGSGVGNDWGSVQDDSATEVWYNALPNTGGAEPLSEMAPNPEVMYGPGSLFFLPGAKYPSDRGSRPYFCFAMNHNLNKDGGTPPKMSSISKTSRTVIFAENGLPPEALNGEPYRGDAAMSASQFVARYGRKTGVLGFADGHALYYPQKKVLLNGSPIVPQTELIWTIDPTDTPE